MQPRGVCAFLQGPVQRSASQWSRIRLASLFFVCPKYAMFRIDRSIIAEALLTAPGWARVGISDPKPWLREDAALELATTILQHADVPDDSETRQANLTL